MHASIGMRGFTNVCFDDSGGGHDVPRSSGCLSRLYVEVFIVGVEQGECYGVVLLPSKKALLKKWASGRRLR